MWQLDHKEGRILKNWCFWTVVLEKTLESLLNSKGIKPVTPQGNQSLIFIGRTDAEAKAPILWLPDSKNWLIGKDPDAGKDWRQKEKGAPEDETVGWHHWLNGHESERTPGDSGGQRSLAGCSPGASLVLIDFWMGAGHQTGQAMIKCWNVQPYSHSLDKRGARNEDSNCSHLWIHLPMQETQVTQLSSLGQEDPLEKEVATRSSVLACRIAWTEEPEGL